MADFPRGGGSSITPLEAQRIKDSAMQDVLFGVSIQNHIITVRQKIHGHPNDYNYLLVDQFVDSYCFCNFILLQQI